MKKLYLILITLFSCLGGPKAAAQEQEPRQIIARMADAFHAFVGDADQSDELTMMAIQRI